MIAFCPFRLDNIRLREYLQTGLVCLEGSNGERRLLHELALHEESSNSRTLDTGFCGAYYPLLDAETPSGTLLEVIFSYWYIVL
jgi:hypothetical protein